VARIEICKKSPRGDLLARDIACRFRKAPKSLRNAPCIRRARAFWRLAGAGDAIANRLWLRGTGDGRFLIKICSEIKFLINMYKQMDHK
jgi:hypothetical protein